ncbi:MULTISPECIES: hypothetical protein [unclassified Nocardioides]|uniref:hypothetical protein n=1 Tax=unclassified Nocardioides TaxID=2615069 RepID=UPI0030150474
MPSHRASLLGCLVLTLTATTVPLAAGVAGADDGTVSLDRAVNGVAAVRALGGDLDDAARLNGQGPDELRELLLDDSTAWVDTDGRVFYRDVLPDLAPTLAPTDGASTPYALDQTFRLHSKPGSARTIFLDFDGGSVAGSDWVRQHGVDAKQPGWSIDRSSAFSSEERAIVQDVWQRVAEDYAPFDVDVTTQDPGAAAIARSGAGDSVFGTRVLITTGTQAHHAICGSKATQACAGVAYLDGFDAIGTTHDRLQPAWVFAANFPTFAKGIAETASHEAGHTLGLHHDGTDKAEYYSGHGMWAPIMGGGGYPKAVTQWSQGSYAKANNREDDVAVITRNGLPLRADEAGSTVATAATLPGGTAYISHRTDVDVYGLGTCTGAVSVVGRNAPNSPNLDLRLRLLDATGAAVATANPTSGTGTPSWDVTTGTDATVSVAAASGPLFVEVDGVGNGTWARGYDDYGSLGAYSLEPSGSCSGFVGAAPMPTTPPKPAKATVTAPGPARVRASHAGRRGGRITAGVQWTPPATVGGASVTGYRVVALRLDARGRATRSKTSAVLGAGRRTAELRLRSGRYRFAVQARNRAGWGPLSTPSRAVRAR